ncbi:MAG: cytochrome P450 [Rhodobacterales bacterium]|jgi:cytochrome P450|nr:cytochrome P450 [Rhodobacter sp.]
MTVREILPPKPASRPDKVSWWRYIQLFRKDIFSSQPARLYHAWMAEFHTPFFRSFLVNQPDLIKLVLAQRPADFPKSELIRESLESLLGNSVFVTNGEVWKRQRRIIDPAFEGGRLRDVFPAMVAAGEAAIARLDTMADGNPVEMEEEASHMAADVIFRTLFSMPISTGIAAQVFDQFRAYQRTQPLLNLASFIRLPRWMPKFRQPATVKTARVIRKLLTELTAARMAEITAGTAPDDLATKIMTTADPLTGQKFDTQEMVDQVAIFFLAGHETSASAIAWTLYLLALDPTTQERLASEVTAAFAQGPPEFKQLSKLSFTRDVFRESLRLYPPVPMMIRTATRPESFRDRAVKVGDQIIVSPWHLHRHDRLWDRPDIFDPTRWKTENGKACQREAFIPFSSGPRVCTGAGFAMVEGPLLLAMLLRQFRFDLVDGKTPVPVAHLTVRSADGIYLRITRR